MVGKSNDTLPENLDEQLGFSVAHDIAVPYMHRTRTYYQALGYEQPYRWAQFVDVPFVPLKKPLSQSRVVVLTTAAQFQPDKGDQGPWSNYNSAAKFYRIYSVSVDPVPDLRISHVGIDRVHTSQEPVQQVQGACPEGFERGNRHAGKGHGHDSREAAGRRGRGPRPAVLLPFGKDEEGPEADSR